MVLEGNDVWLQIIVILIKNILLYIRICKRHAVGKKEHANRCIVIVDAGS